MVDDDTRQYFRRFARREYLRQHESQRRANAKTQGARRLDVTLHGKSLEDYETVCGYLRGMNRLAAERKLFGFPIRLSATEVVRLALSRAAFDILEEDAKAAKSGQLRMLADE
jgi:hypothetical protein